MCEDDDDSMCGWWLFSLNSQIVEFNSLKILKVAQEK